MYRMTSAQLAGPASFKAAATVGEMNMGSKVWPRLQPPVCCRRLRMVICDNLGFIVLPGSGWILERMEKGESSREREPASTNLRIIAEVICLERLAMRKRSSGFVG